jgi:surfeit locus 1 family protein
MPFRFQFRWIPFIAAVLAAIIGVSLGQWQLDRASYKETIEEKLAHRQAAPPVILTTAEPNVDDIEFRRITVTGEFMSTWPIYLDNRPNQGKAGFNLVMPLKISNTNQFVLVMRGWLPRDPVDRTRLPSIPVPSGTVTIDGIARRHTGHLLQLGKPETVRPGAILQNLDLGQFELASKLDLHPIVIEQTSDVQDGLVRDWPRPSAGVDKHLGYAFQWYGLAATALIFFVVTGIKRGKKSAG